MAEESKITKLKFHYEKSKQFRVIHVDGAHGGLSASGRGIVMNLYSERKPIPKEETFVSDDGAKTFHEDMSQRNQLEGLFREVEVSAIMDIEVAKVLAKWLERKISDHEKIIDAERATLEAK